MPSRYKAVPFQAPDGAEIIGLAVRAFFDNLERDSWEPILRRYDLNERSLRDDGWYPYQLFLDLTRELYEKPTGTNALVANGKAIGQNFYNDRVNGIEQFLTELLNQVVSGALRNVPDGIGYIVEKRGDQHYRITNNLPSDNETVYGYLWESCRLYNKQGERFVVEPISGYPGSNQSAVFDVRWGKNI